ncbi:MAG: 2-phosphosulfolactate phosphatase [Firmicutes bacterium]|nr:2-phosphosulfolactate phosphatase [Bacillota bacterium]
MMITTVFKKADISNLKNTYRVAVVLDVLRATTTITTALKNGCREVIPVADVDEARKLGDDPNVLLCGERSAVKLPGFNLGNSPLEFNCDTVSGKTVVLTTTNGTGAIKMAAKKSGTVVIGSLLNSKAVAKKLLQFNGDILLVCSGTRGNFSMEDTLAAGFIVKEFLSLKGIKNYSGQEITKQRSNVSDVYAAETPIDNNIENNIVLNDSSVAAYRISLFYNDNTLDALYDSLHGQKLAQLGMRHDLTYCSKLNTCNLVPIYKDGIITATT